MKTFQEAELFFDSRRKLGIKPGLERLDYLLKKTGHPERRIKTIHVAGTNGKGSTITYMEEVLIANGYTVGTFVSPGLPTIRDHMRINRQTITEQSFIDILHQLLPVIREMDGLDLAPSEYEILMVMTLLYFLEKTDIALIETCMGGREDVTNRVEPIVTVITTIDYDHMGFLGNSLAEIAAHKAGIIKHGTPVVVGDLPKEASEVVLKKASKEEASIYFFNTHFQIKDWKVNSSSQQFVFSYQTEIPAEITMIGKHQAENAALALMVLHLLMEKGWSIRQDAMLKGLKQAKITNRLQILNNSPGILIDGAHNVASIKKLIETSKLYWNNRKIYTLFSAFKDKEVDQMTHLLKQYSNKFVVTTFDHPRALSEQDVAEDIEFLPDYKEALTELMQQLNPEDVLLITGSLHFVEEIKGYISRI
ncbi:dihydrofolate synthase / folylpolyglutamate synthase [Gracilibacillus ureilyticus]|uniref:tetrahydrofolate synthase n=1 Tax=Gracilibacillus ureilyticus TaxID=531814 RepID=A0A1H9RPV3_9BACI|nr:folylpolyglutamate synthase/dihydrofolate synthase family protein [Gracilibacillus ureilyticus]SER74792.1 dihydrofolate synthase / folylpolyglutamate synthase [Gracilibacillus ureilyticus]